MYSTVQCTSNGTVKTYSSTTDSVQVGTSAAKRPEIWHFQAETYVPSDRGGVGGPNVCATYTFPGSASITEKCAKSRPRAGVICVVIISIVDDIEYVNYVL